MKYMQNIHSYNKECTNTGFQKQLNKFYHAYNRIVDSLHITYQFVLMLFIQFYLVKVCKSYLYDLQVHGLLPARNYLDVIE